jgi:hypothetical protein
MVLNCSGVINTSPTTTGADNMTYTAAQLNSLSRTAEKMAAAATILISDHEQCTQANQVTHLIAEMRLAAQLMKGGQSTEAAERLLGLFADYQPQE